MGHICLLDNSELQKQVPFDHRMPKTILNKLERPLVCQEGKSDHDKACLQITGGKIVQSILKVNISVFVASGPGKFGKWLQIDPVYA